MNDDKLNEIVSEVIDRVLEFYDCRTQMDSFNPYQKRRACLTEGLIRTYPLSALVNAIRKFDNRNYGIVPVPFDKTRKSGKKQFVLYCTFNDGMNKLSQEDFSKFLQVINTCGWYVSQIFGKKIKNVTEDSYAQLSTLGAFTMIIEPKFDLIVDDEFLPKDYYHITKAKYLPKIKKKGLVPKHQDKVTYHPERIYLFGAYPSNWKNTADFYRSIENNQEKYCLLKISGEYINCIENVYYDPNSNLKEAFFVLNPIPPSEIEVVDYE